MPFLTELLSAYKGPLAIHGEAEHLSIHSVTADSRQVMPGALFFALCGAEQDGASYVVDAVHKGAVAVVLGADAQVSLPRAVPIVRVEQVREALAKIAASFYAPAPACVVAVTGTDGKSSTVDFFRQLWQMSYQKAACIGTLGIVGVPKPEDYPMSGGTTPGAVQLHKTLQKLASEQYRYVAFEASSHGLHQHRLDGAELTAAAFTNFTRDHLDYHSTIEAYFEAKARLFDTLLPSGATAVLNADDARFAALNAICEARGHRVTSYGMQGRQLRIKRISATADGLAVQAEIMGASQHFMLEMFGGFQAMNALAALGLYVGCGGKVEEGLAHLPHLRPVPGRMEKVAVHPSGANIFVDYAHTPAALGTALQALRAHNKGRVVALFGCGGDRDPGKRAEMGRMAVQYADDVIITDDNPRGEEPARIRNAVQEGAPHAKNIGDRAEAIAFAVKGLNANDVLLIAGKGHEKTQIIGGRTLPFDDALVANYAVKLSSRKA